MTARLADLVTWVPWSAEAFARAARERKPVLLSITAAWCHACHEMDRTTYVDDRVVALIQDRFVAIRVDADKRPDINERYNLGGWPTTAFLTPDGHLLGGGTFVPVDRMPRVLEQVIDAIETRTGEIAQAQSATIAAVQRSEQEPPLAEIVDAVFASFDDEHGGFGLEPKFPLTAPLHLALTLYRERADPHWRAIVERTLDGIQRGGLHDANDGGFFRYATTRDWQLPHVEKLLETNASLLRIFVDAAAMLESPRYREASAGLAAFMRRRFLSPAGGYYGSDADTIVYTDASASASGALLAASALLEDPGMGREALEQLERVLLASYRPGGGVAHYLDGTPQVRGLLADQTAMIHLLLDAQTAAGGEPYGMMAEELAHFVLRTMWDASSGQFFDRAHEHEEVGLLRARRTPFVINAEAARAFARLARTSGEPDFRVRAEATVRALARTAPAQGPLAAHYVMALGELSVR